MAQVDEDVKAFENDKYAMDKYSRQVGEFGLAAMAKLVQMKVLVIGLKGVGIEVAKNLILAGVGSVTLLDEELVKISDLGTNFYLKEEDVGKISVAEASLGQLKSLNPLVNVSLHTGKLTNKHTKKFSFVVDCGLTAAEAVVCDEQCRRSSSDTKFVRTRVHGLMGYAFNDFGDKFSVVDMTGEQPVVRVIDKIESDPEKPGELIVRLIADKRHNIDFDNHVNFIKFEEVEGDLGNILCGAKEPFEVQENKRTKTDGSEVFDPFSLRVILGEKVKVPAGEIAYDGSGQIVQVKKKVDIGFSSLRESLKNPIHKDVGMLAFTDGTKFGRPEQLHMALNGLWAYETKHKQLPTANDEEAVAEVVALAKEYNQSMKANADAFSVEEVDEKVVSYVARYAECNFQPLCAFFGGIVAQEVVKFTGKYTPLRQWLHIDCFEVHPSELVDEETEDAFKVTPEDCAPMGCRYDDTIKILGKPLHQKLMKSSTFMVGCGALGCELLKNFALLGLACDDSGLITVTDNDQIEISNLSRQFLFREDNVGQAKSLAAGDSVRTMNSAINVKSLENLVGPDTEAIFNSEFWQKQDFITNALDNVKARLYVDKQCVFYGKALLESGTLGTKCNSQIIIPHMTASYEDGPKDDVGEGIPMCTLRNFPSQIEHCIEWSRARFTDLFETDSTKAVNFLSNPEGFLKDLNEKKSDLSAVARELGSLNQVVHILKTASDSETSFKTCVEEAFAEFHASYRDRIAALIKAKPEDCLDEDGEPFWGKSKRFPQAADFDPENATHVSFILSMANILSLTYGLVSSTKEFVTDAEEVKKITSGLKPPAEIQAKVDLTTEEDDPKEAAVDDKELDEFNALVAELETFAKEKELKDITIEPASFEKDDDSNFHIDYITASSNLRGWNYRMKDVPRHKCKLIAGKIIPAIATTTAAVTGLICIEMIKLLQPGKKLEAFKDSSNSLGVNYYQFMEPAPPSKAQDSYDVELLADVKCLPEGFTKWDKTVIEGDLTLSAFLEAFKAQCKEKYDKDLSITYLLHANANFKELQGYNKIVFSQDDDEPNENLERPLKDVLVELYGSAAIGKSKVKLMCNVNDEEGDPYTLPQLVFVFA